MHHLLTLLIVLTPLCAQAQVNTEPQKQTDTISRENTYKESFAVHLQGGMVASFHNASPPAMTDNVNRGASGTDIGFGPVFNLIIEVQTSKLIGFGFGIGYADRSVETEAFGVSIEPLYDSTITFGMPSITALTYLEIQPDLRLAIIGKFKERKLGVHIGPRFAFPLETSTLRSEALYGLSAGIETILPVSRKTALIPSLSADVFFNDILKNANWKTWGIRAEIGIRFSLGKETELKPIVPPPPPPPAVTFTPVFVATTSSSFTGEFVTGNELRASPPIVNAVFFDSASSTIPGSYLRSVDGSTPSSDPVEAHAWALLDIAEILSQNPQATIVLEGATSGPVTEPEGIALATRRANEVKTVLENMGIKSNRILIQANVDPRIVSNPEYPGGRVENRRVDLTVVNAPLQKWITTQRFAELHGTLSVSAMVVGGDPAKHDSAVVSITSKHLDTTIKGKHVNLIVPVLNALRKGQDTSHVQVGFSSSGAYSLFDTVISVSALPMRQVQLQTREFEAILRFDYNSSVLSDDIKHLLDQLVEQLPDGSTLSIVGGADILGTEEGNRRLSEKRAENTVEYVRSISGSRFTVNTALSDSDTDKAFFTISNDTPQGRFFNRSIRIHVYTKND